MNKKMRFSVSAILIAVAVLVFCVGFSHAYAISVTYDYTFSLKALSRDNEGSATANYGDSRLNIAKPSTKEGAEVLLYFFSFFNAGRFATELIADSDGNFFESVAGFTDETGRFKPTGAAPTELLPIWYRLDVTDTSTSLTFSDPEGSSLGYDINFTFQWFDSAGYVQAQTSMSGGEISTTVQRTDCRCVVTVSTNYVTYVVTLPNAAAASYSITYELGGGSFLPGYTPQYSYSGEQVILPDENEVSLTGHRFDGWYDNIGCEGERITEISETDTGDKIYYAKWIPEVYSVTLHTNGGESGVALTEYTYGEGATLPNATLKGHDFLGWYVDENFEGERIYNIGANDTGAVSFYAKWKASEYTIVYKENGGSIADDAQTVYTYGIGAELPNATKTGHRFDGWYDNIGCEGERITEISASDTCDKIYYAKWIPEVYSVTLHTNGGEAGVALTEYTYGEGATLPNATLKGHDFLGWYEDENFEGDRIYNIGTNDTGAVSFYAKWKASEYTIEYKESGGSIADGAQTVYTYGIGAELPNATKTGHRFDGWYDNIGCQGERITEISASDTGDKIYYAKWIPEVYSVTLHTNGGEAGVALTEYTYGEGATLPNATLKGHNFLGWYEDENFEGDRIYNIGTNDTGAVSFYAKWKASEYTIVYKENGGSIADGAHTVYTYGIGAGLPNATKTGHRFDGWYDNIGCQGERITEISESDTGDKIYYAKWIPEVYSVTLHTNGGESGFDLTGYTYGLGAWLPSVFLDGHRFDGWYLSSEFSGSPITNITENDWGNLVFYAMLTPITYSIEYELYGGVINSGEVTSYTYKAGAVLPQNVTRGGYAFLGWYDNPEFQGNAVYELSISDLGNKTFYARWHLEGYSIEYETYGGIISGGQTTAYMPGEEITLPQNITKTGYKFKGWYLNEHFEGNSYKTYQTADDGNLKFYARWEAEVYTITFIGADCEPSSYTYGDTVLLTDPTRTGYIFNGWFADNKFDGDEITCIISTDYGDKVFYAKWTAKTYNIEYDFDGGNPNGTVITTCSFGEVINLNENVTKTGYKFKGWFTASGDRISTFTVSDKGNLKFYAKWEAEVYTITYSDYESDSYTYGDTVELFVPSRTGYIFDGWFVDEEFSGDAITVISSTDYGNKVFFAKWTAKTYNIEYDFDDGEASGAVVTICSFGETVVLNEKITKTGYTFKGWYNENDEHVTSFTVGDNGNLRFYAKWEAEIYTITYSDYESGSYTYGDTIELVVPTRTGYIFDGWFADAEFSGDEITAISSTDYGNKVFFAKWTAKTYNIEYDFDGGEANGTVITTCTFGEVITLNENITKIGYIFDGWYNESGDRVTTFTVGDNGDLKFYARWEAEVYTITYSDYESGSYTYGDTVELFVPSRTGYIFDGWFVDEEFSGEKVTKLTSTDYGNKVFFAKWTAKTYNIEYAFDNGEANGVILTSCTFGDTVTLNENIIKTGYIFKGWYNENGDHVTTFIMGDNGDLKFYARWEAEVYKITYTDYAIDYYTYGDTVELVVPSRIGYIFDGWFVDEEFNGNEVTVISSTDYGNKVFFAKWTAKTYNIEYDFDGGEASGVILTTCTFGDTITLNENITKTGYIFTGWYTASGDRVTTFKVGDNGNLKFYAKWEVEVYRITYTDYAIDYYTYGDTVELVMPTRTGYIFNGWFADAEFSGNAITAVSSTDYGNKVFFAKWTAKTYNIEYDFDGGEANGAVITTCTFSEFVTLNENITKTGYKFTGWYTASGNRITSFIVGDNGNLKFYARWEAEVYKISYTDYAIDYYTYGDTVELVVPSRAGYIFNGWFTNAEFSGVEVITVSSTDYGNKVFFAKWTAKTYNIEYDFDGGEANGAVVTTCTFGEVITLNENITKTGYIFKGWYNASGDRVTTFKVGDNGNLKFYAKWEAEVYKITYNDYAIDYYTYGEAIELVIPSRTGYIFNGWFADEEFSGEEITAISVADYGNKVFFAKWTAKTYSIEYDIDGGEANGAVLTSCTFGDTITLNENITKTGYTFTGWYIASGNRVTSFIVGDNGSLKFYARWEAEVYKITYTDYAIDYYTYGDNIELVTPTRIGYIFDGWFADEEFSGDAITAISSTDYGNKVFYAKWTAKTYNIEYYLDGGEASGAVITTCTFGELVTLNENITKTGYIFKGWYTASGNRITSFIVGDNGSLKFYAKWEVEVYKITYTGYAIDYYTYGDNIELVTPTRIGYIFDGWFADEGFSGEKVTTIKSTDYGNKVFFAKWTAKTYNIEYDFDDGEANGTIITTCTFGKTVTLNENITKTGYKFTGWYTASGDRITSFTVGDNGNLKFYARWDAATYKITYSGYDIDWYTYGEAVGLITPTRIGYIFGGWFTDAEFSGKSVTGISSSDYGDKVFYAKWMAKTYRINAEQGAGYTLSVSAEYVEYGGSFEITFELAEGFIGGQIYINGGLWTGSGRYYGVEFDINITVSGVELDARNFYIYAEDGTYNGNEHIISAVSGIDTEVVFSWYIDGELVKTATGTQSGLAVTNAGTYNITVVISVAGAGQMTVSKSTVVIISKADLGESYASFTDGVIVLYTAGGGTSGYILCGEGELLDGNTLAALHAGTYTFIAAGDGNHVDSQPFSITIYAVTLVSEGKTVAVYLASYGSTLDINLAAEKSEAADFIYKFSGWYYGDKPFSGLVEGDMLLNAVFTEYIKVVSGGGVTVTSDGGMDTGATVELSDDVSAEVIETFTLETAEGVAVHFVDISLYGGTVGASYTVTYRLPSEFWGMSLAVYHYLPDGSVERVRSYVDGGNIVFITNGFSPFAFFDVTQYTLRGVDGDGNTYYLGSYTNGDYVTLSAVAHPASEGYVYIFEGWYAEAGLGAPLSGITVNGNITLHAKFTQKEWSTAAYYNVTAVDKNGNVYYIGSYAAGSTADLTAYKVTPGGSYAFEGLYDITGDKVEQMLVDRDICLYVMFTYTGGNLETEPEPVYRTLHGISGTTVYNLFSYEEGTALSLTLFSLPAYEADGKTYIFEGWYSDAELTNKIDNIMMNGDMTIYAKFIVREVEAGGVWLAIAVGSASAALLLIVLVVVIAVKTKPRQVQIQPMYPVQAQAAGHVLMRAEENYRYICGEVENAENYLRTNPDREKGRAASNARGLLKECEYILKGMRERANTPSGAKENNFAEASLDRLFYEINSIISGEIFA